MKISRAVLSTILFQTVSLGQASGGVRGSKQHGRVLRNLDESCIAAVGVIDYDDGTPDSTFLDCETPSGKHYKVPVEPGWISEKMKAGQLKSGLTELDVPGAVIDVEAGELILPDQAKPNLFNKHNHERKLVTGTRTVLVVRVIASDGQTGSNEANLSDSVFGTSGDVINLKSQYEDCSHGQLSFNPASNRNKVGGGIGATDIVNGVTTVNVAVSTTQGDATMRNEITAALNQQFGVSNPTALANHVMYCLPPNTMSGIAYAFVNSWMSVYSNQWCTYPSAQMHEVRTCR